MPEVLCLSHQGIRCGMPPRWIMGAVESSPNEAPVCLWRGPASVARLVPNPEQRAFQLSTALGPRWIWGSDARLCSVSAAKLWPLPPLLRELVPLPHLVGVAEIAGDLVWLVDPTRFRPVPAEVNTEAESAV